MKIIHIADLHIGKIVNGYSLIEDQRFILNQIIEIAKTEQIDCVLIAGDIYDNPLPNIEAVKLFDYFLTEFAKNHIEVLLISGNHDQAERISFGSKLMEKSGIYFAPSFDKKTFCVTKQDLFGEVNFYFLPFIKPQIVRFFYPTEKIESYTDAIRVAIQNMNVDFSKRNVLLTHQFVTGSIRCESEEISVGGSDNVNVEVFDGFDYVALGHLHQSQKVGKENIRYSGSPLKYSFSECKHKKSLTIIELNEKQNIQITQKTLNPLRDMKEITGNFEQIVSEEFRNSINQDDYFHFILKDEDDIENAASKLQSIYKNFMLLSYDNKRTQQSKEIELTTKIEQKTPLELFENFYEQQNNQPLNKERKDFLSNIIEEIWGI